jgi:hypothetical protein
MHATTQKVSTQGAAVLPFARLLLLLASAIASSGCESILDVKAPSRIPADAVQVPQNAGIMVDGAQADFECALANYIVAGGQIGDELMATGQGAATWGYDRRSYTAFDPWYANFPCEGGTGAQGATSVYVPLHTARAAATVAARLLEEWDNSEVPGRSELLARASAFAGYSTLLLGEGFCSNAVDLGPELSRREMFELAEEEFSRAVGAAEDAQSSTLIALAQLGRARARLNLENFAGALNDAAAVPPGYRFAGRYSVASTRTQNRVFVQNVRSRIISVGPLYRDLEIEGVSDHRVPVRNDGVVLPGRTDTLWVQELYTSEASAIPIATWQEAQLIIAEAELESGNADRAVDALNALRAHAGLPTFNGSDPQEVRDQVIEERRRVLFLQGHHLNDLIRFELPLVPEPGTPYPRVGGTYGDLTCLPLPEIERRGNPNMS